VVAEICIDEFPLKMFAATGPLKRYHTAKHDLHDDEARKVFFS